MPAADVTGLGNMLRMLRCPRTGQKVHLDGNQLVNEDGSQRYAISPSGVACFEASAATEEARIQQRHYDRVASAYVTNLGYPHTQEYSKYLDDKLIGLMSRAVLGNVAEICCGSGEAFRLIDKPIGTGIGVDISAKMLEAARSAFPSPRYQFIQGDATNLPLDNGLFDTVVMSGGIHHVNQRQKLFDEIFRILKPGGNFYFREPCDDFTLWRAIRKVIYRVSPALDHETERPLRHGETVPYLERAGFRMQQWETCGFLGFCVFMNSDVLVFNRLFRFIPGIRAITRLSAAVDDWTVRLPMLRGSGLQVVGWAQRP
jgi:ubiquinone/menaquinone biosynthesis C-methylase UbiE